MPVDYTLIGSRIKAKRKELHQTQEQLAEKLSVTVGYVSQVERGVTHISLDTLAHICEALDGDMAYFVTGAAANQELYLKNEWLERFQQLNTVQKKIIMEIADVLLKNNTERK